MDWIRQNNFLATFGGIMIVGILGLGYFAFSGWKGYSASLEEFESKSSALASLEGSKLHPDEENLKKVKEEVDKFEKAVDGLFDKLSSAQAELPKDVDVTKLGSKIQEKLAPFEEKANSLKVSYDKTFYMGMEDYREKQARNDPEVLQKLEWQLGGIAELADLVLDSGIDSLDQLYRYAQPWETAAVAEVEPVVKKPSRSASSSSRNSRSSEPKAGPTAKVADVMESGRVRLKLTGTPDSITKFFNLVSNSPDYFYWIRWMKIANENPAGPSRSALFNPTPVVEDDAGATEEPRLDAPPAPEAADAAEPGPPAMIDVFPILGMERVRADLVIDIVRFRNPPAPPEKASNRKK